MKSNKNILMLVLLAALISPSAFAEEGAAPAGMDPAMMAKMKALTSPTEAHKAFEQFAGKWNYKGTFWMTADSPAMEMTGVAENTIVYGGRFLKQTTSGPWMGETFEGIGYTGYDNVRQEYQSVWIDSSMTSIMSTTGQYDAASKTFTFSGENSCPLTGDKNHKGRSTWSVTDADHSTFTSYEVKPDGTERKAMEIVYTRA